MYSTLNFWVSGLYPSSGISRNTLRFGNWICFRPQVKKVGRVPAQLGPLERANLNHWTTAVKVKVTLRLTVGQSVSLGPLDLATIFYCLSLETSLFVASYDSQGQGGGIRLYCLV
jgi:hypothetical protein